MYLRAMAGIQILVIEDDPMQSKLVGFLLEEAGHNVRIVESAEEALTALQSFLPDRIFRPDLILMDIQLPGKDGLELTRELRLSPTHSSTPIVALTAYTDPSDRALAHQAGCNGVVSKPIDPAVFARQVRNFIGSSNGDDKDVPADGNDLLAGMRNRFLGEGLDQCRAILKELSASPSCAIEKIRRLLHQWAATGKILGFPEISSEALRIEALTNSSRLEPAEVRSAIQTARRRFCAATRTEPVLPLALIRGLRDVRTGLVNFSEEEANRIRTAANRSNVRVTLERIRSESIHPSGYDALVVNQCSLSADQALQGWTIPILFVGSRSSLESLSRLPAREHDFLIAPWDAEEVLLRLYRLIVSAIPLPPPAESSHMPRRRPRVLIADDDPDLASLVSATLSRSGMDCDFARSGRQALDFARRHPPDAILLDVNMPDFDGFEVLKKLRHNLTTQAIPVLMLTARGQESDITMGAGAGADDYVVKPFDLMDLTSRLDKIIARRR